MTDPQQPYSSSRRSGRQRRQRRPKPFPLSKNRNNKPAAQPPQRPRSGTSSGMFGDMVDPSRHVRRRSNRSSWPPQPKASFFPKLPKSLVYGVRLLIIGLGVAAIAGTVLSVLTPADESLGQ
ncbi:MAG: hypothetical protein AAF959_12920, partial [Cyanobacteria bacterium P01_D01_bin.56]